MISAVQIKLDRLKSSLIDPQSAMFENVTFVDDSYICGYVNSKNRMGGYSGKARFKSDGLDTLIEQDAGNEPIPGSDTFNQDSERYFGIIRGNLKIEEDCLSSHAMRFVKIDGQRVTDVSSQTAALKPTSAASASNAASVPQTQNIQQTTTAAVDDQPPARAETEGDSSKKGLMPPADDVSDICEAKVKIGVPAIENSESFLESGSVYPGLTQYWSTPDGIDKFCFHGGYCYPGHVKTATGLAEVMKPQKCTLDLARGDPTGGEGTLHYFHLKRAEVPASALKLNDLMSRLEDRGMCNACASNAADAYLKLQRRRAASSCSASLVANPRPSRKRLTVRFATDK